MSTIADFNRIDDCNQIDALCVNAYADFDFDPESDTGICLHTSWGGNCLDLTDIVKNAETCTTLYLSPEDNPNCLVYEPECGDNICIHGDDLSRIISMHLLKDVDQTTPPTNGTVYIYDGTTDLFKPFDLSGTIYNLNTTIQNMNSAITNLQNRVTTLEQKLIPPADAPEDVSVMFGNINIYSDSNAVVNSSGTATSLDKTHGLYSHLLADNVYGDELFG